VGDEVLVSWSADAGLLVPDDPGVIMSNNPTNGD
jgi:hypothetical protein